MDEELLRTLQKSKAYNGEQKEVRQQSQALEKGFGILNLQSATGHSNSM